MANNTAGGGAATHVGTNYQKHESDSTRPGECDLAGYNVPGLALQPVKRRVGDVGEWDSINRAGVDDPGNRAHLVQLGVDKGHALVEVLVAEQRRFEGQQLLTSDSQIGIPQVLEGLQE